MKNFLIVLLACFLSVATISANMTVVKRIFEDSVVSGSSSLVCTPINLSEDAGQVSLQWTLAGSGTVTIDYLVSNDGINFYRPTTAIGIVTGATAGSGLAAFYPEFAKFISIRVLETAGSSITINAWLAMQ